MSLLAASFLLATAAARPAAGDFEALVWRQSGTPPAEAARVLEAFGGAVVLRGEPRAAHLERGLDVLLFNAPGRDELHLERDRPGYAPRWQRWYETRDDALLVRVPCLSEASTLATLQGRLDESLSAGDAARLVAVSLGDEVGLTAHGAPEDVCLSAACREAWRRFLAGRADLGPGERERFADPAAFSTDATRLAFGEGRTEALRPWLLRRRFHESVLRSVLVRLARRARERAPAARLALLGVGAQSPFGTPRLELLLEELDVAEAYDEVDARALLHALRAPGQSVLATVFPDPGDPARGVHDLWEHWLRGGDGVVVWSDLELARAPALLERTAQAVADIRAARAALADFAPRPAGAAVLHDFDSLCVAWLRDALLDGPTWPRRFSTHQQATGTWERGLRGWLRLLADCGLQPGSLPLERVGADTPSRFGLLVASHLEVVDPDDLARLEAYLRAGGALLVHGRFAELDSRGARPAADPLARLREAGGERLVLVEGDAGDYPFERSRRTARARAWRTAARGWLADARVALPPWRVEPQAEDLPWLSAWSVDDAGIVSGAVQPAWHDVQGAGGLGDLALELVPAEGYQLRWVHPPEPAEPGSAARLLPAGDAAAFRLVPRAR